MKRARVILGLFLSLPLLVLWADLLSDPVSHGPVHPPTPSVSSGDHPEPDSDFAGYSFDRSARRWTRRLDKFSSAPAGLGHLQPITLRLALPVAQSFDLPRRFSEEAFHLTVSWQFRYRAALDPRAPSSVS
jgi:hypothetical protein